MSSKQYHCNTCGNDENFMDQRTNTVDFVPDLNDGTKAKINTVTIGICASCKGVAESLMETKARSKKPKRPFTTRALRKYRTSDGKYFEGYETTKDHVLDIVTGNVWRKSKVFKVKKNDSLELV